MDKLNIFSYNSTGFDIQKINFIKTVLLPLNADILVVQEHMTLRLNAHLIQNEFPSYFSTFQPAHKSDENISKGRPSGGLFILWNKKLNKSIKVLNIENNPRVQAIEINNSVILFNCYFPCDTRNLNYDDWELQRCLRDINNISNSYPNHSIIVAGDLNCFFQRNTPFVNTIRDWVMESNLKSVWWDNPIDFTFSNVLNDRQYFSVIDHFLYNDIAETIIKDSGVLHFGENLSNHSPIYLTIEIKPGYCLFSSLSQNNVSEVYKPNWSKANSEDLKNYNNDLSKNLSSIKISDGLLCNNLKCIDNLHREDIDNFASSVLNSIDNATSCNIPPVSSPHQKKVIGWNEYVKPFKDDANFYYAIWLSYGKPLNCPLHQSMKRSRNIYHLAIRRVKNNIENIRNEKFAEHCLKKNPQELLKDFKKLKNASKVRVENMDGFHGDKEISQHFGNLYKQLYSKNDSTDSLKDEYNFLSNQISNEDIDFLDLISPSKIYEIIIRLDKNRNDSTFRFKSDAFLNGKDILCKYLAVFFQAAFVHGYLPKNILLAKLQPIIKDKLGSKCNSSNYRAIGISSILLKILDLLLLDLFHDSLRVSEQQFGFQKNCSTTFCTFTVKETTNYFLNRNTPVFACFLDMTKAFDLISYHKLFLKLRSRVPPLFLRLLCYIYLNQSACAVWGDSLSDEFSVKNGVKQGAILSPTLFAIYIDDIFDVLKNSGLGCTIKNNYYGVIGYADDLVLLSPNKEGLQKMFNISKKFFDELDLIISFDHINPDKSKTKCLAFGVKNDPNPIYFDNSPIPWVKKFKHLGHILYKDGNSNHDTDLKKNIFIGKFHSLCQLLKKKDPEIYVRLIKVYLIDFYGSNLWNLYDKSTEKFYITWNKMIRNVFNLPFRTHRYLIEPISGINHLKTMLTDRFIKFYDSILNCDKNITRNLAILQAKDCRSDFGRNIYNICREKGVQFFKDISKGDIKYFPISYHDEWRISILKELLQSKFYFFPLNYDEINFMIEHIACS